jgi:hypothetical protein
MPLSRVSMVAFQAFDRLCESADAIRGTVLARDGIAERGRFQVPTTRDPGRGCQVSRDVVTQILPSRDRTAEVKQSLCARTAGELEGLVIAGQNGPKDWAVARGCSQPVAGERAASGPKAVSA